MAITAKMVKDLRTMTGAGMMECKNALTEANGDMDTANDILRKRGLKIADKKAGRDTNQGLVGVRVTDKAAYVVMVNCETDFVARNEKFQAFVTEYLDQTEKGTTFSNEDVAAIITEIGENIQLAGSGSITGITAQILGAKPVELFSYVHSKLVEGMGSIGVIVSITGNVSAELGKQIAMHIAATNPKAVSVDNLDPEFVANERRLFTEQAEESGKPANIVEKMVEGRMNKILREVTLTEQPFVIDPDTTVGKVLKEANAEVVRFIRLAIGE